MDRIDTLRSVGDAERADPADDTVINGTPYDPSKTIGDVVAVAGRTAYRDEYLRNHGPDLDESLDGTESGQEI